MPDDLVSRARVRYILSLIILATIPCYCVGFMVIWLRPLLAHGKVTETPTQTWTPSPTHFPGLTLVYPTPILPSTLTITPEYTATLFVPPTHTLTPFYPPTQTPTMTLTITVTSTPTATSTLTLSPTAQPSPTDTQPPPQTPTGTPPTPPTPE